LLLLLLLLLLLDAESSIYSELQINKIMAMSSLSSWITYIKTTMKTLLTFKDIISIQISSSSSYNTIDDNTYTNIVCNNATVIKNMLKIMTSNKIERSYSFTCNNISWFIGMI